MNGGGRFCLVLVCWVAVLPWQLPFFLCVLGSAKAKSSTALTWKTVFNKESISNGVSWQGVIFCIFCHGCQGGSNVKRGVPLGTFVA